MKLSVIKGDITKIKADALVNAANSSLLGGGGVDGALHRAAGPTLLEACKKIVDRQGGCPTGNAVITHAGNLPAKFVVHTVGPIWKGGKNKEAELLSQCYRNSLQLALDNDCKTVAFPNISTGVYGFPKKAAAEIAVQTVSKFLSEKGAVMEVIFVCFDEESFALLKEALSTNELI